MTDRRKRKIQIGRRKTDIPAAFLESFKKELLLGQDKAIASAIEVYVNGGIRGVRKDLEAYIQLDTKWKEEDAEWKEKQEATNKEADPAVKAFKKGVDFLDVLKFLIGLLVVLGGGVIAWATVKAKLL